ncbi:MAG: hypothetical protein ACAH79_03045 [Thermoleophilia bacterium]
MFFSLSSWALALILVAVIVGTTVAGLVAGGRLRKRGDALREPFGVLQTATLGIVALLLAFGLSLAIGRYETRRAAVVDDANTIGTTYLRAQTLAEPVRTRSLDLLRRYTDEAIRISHEVPGSAEMRRTEAAQEVLQRRLWSLAGQALDDAPVASAPRLYVDSLNEMIDQQTVRISALNNRVPGTVLLLEVVASALALGLLALYLTHLGRGPVTVLVAAVVVTMLLFVTFDLDRPTRGLITVPDTPLTTLRASMALPPAAE